MNALDFFSSIVARGATFALIQTELERSGAPSFIEEALDVRSSRTSAALRLHRNELRKLAAIKPLLIALAKVELPDDAMPEEPCDGFEAARGVAICRRCAHSLGVHARRATCAFFQGNPKDGTCRDCKVPFLAHPGIVAARQ